MVTRIEAEELLSGLFAEPDHALTRARAELAPDGDPAVASIGHQIIGIVLRDRGDTEAALAVLRESVLLARRSRDTDRCADARATLGASLATAGRVRDGLAHLDHAAATASGVARGRVLVRRAWVLSFLLSRFADSAADLREARAEFAGAGDRVWEARALNIEGLARIELGESAGAEVAFGEAREIFATLGNDWDVANTVHNEGTAAFVGGRLPEALKLYADAGARLDALGITSVELVVDRCEAYLSGGLAQEALDVVREAITARRLQARERADLLVAMADAALSAGDLSAAISASDEATRLLRAQGRRMQRLRAELLGVCSRAEASYPTGQLLRRAERLVEEGRDIRTPELPQVLLLGAQLARGVRSARTTVLADAWLAEAAAFRRAPIGTTRALGWLAAARGRELDGDRGGCLRACDRGLRALDEHRATLGSVELRARTSGHGAQLAELGTRTALASGNARRLLRWSERWRATALDLPAAARGHDPETAAQLAALRAQHRRIDEARAAGETVDLLQARAARLEQAVRQRLFHARGTGTTASSLDVVALLEALREDDTVLVELTEVDGVLHALVAGRGRVRHFVVGDAVAAAKAVDFALFTLRQAARGRRAQLDVAGARLQRTLLGPAAGGLGESRVVVSGTSALQGVPWALLPSLATRPFTSTPSARLWLRSRSERPSEHRHVLLVGPGLGSGGAEVPAIAAEDPGAEVLDGAAATVEASLTALDGAGLAHIAAHGRFREDSPLFSSLDLADGPLMVHDLQRLKRPPHRVVLSACESGEMAPVGAQELLGLSAALLSMGTAGIVSSLAEVDDAATVDVMVALHARLRQGGGLGDAMLAAREAAAGDPVLAATAASFTALGT